MPTFLNTLKISPQKIEAGGPKLDANNNYDIENRKLVNVAETFTNAGTTSSDAITKNQLDTAIGNEHDNDQNIDLKNTYNFINSKQQAFNEMNAVEILLCVMKMSGMCLYLVRNLFFLCKLIWTWENSLYLRNGKRAACSHGVMDTRRRLLSTKEA